MLISYPSLLARCFSFIMLPCTFFFFGVQIPFQKHVFAWTCQKMKIRRHQPFKIDKVLAKMSQTKIFKLSLMLISRNLLLLFIVSKRKLERTKNQCCFLIHSSYISTCSAKPSSRPTTSPSSIQFNSKYITGVLEKISKRTFRNSVNVNLNLKIARFLRRIFTTNGQTFCFVVFMHRCG